MKNILLLGKGNKKGAWFVPLVWLLGIGVSAFWGWGLFAKKQEGILGAIPIYVWIFGILMVLLLLMVFRRRRY